MKVMQKFLICGLVAVFVYSAMADARPSNALTNNNNEDFENMQTDVDEDRKGYYDMVPQSLYANAPMDPLQYLIAQYRPSAYLRSPNWSNMNELYRMPESKRQVRYRQCYFNPISCFKK